MFRQSALFMIVLGVALLITAEKNASASPPELDAETIKAGLRTTFIEEEGFVDEVVAMAEAGDLPWAMVDNVFSWAKRKPENRFQYFRRALIELAARQGITVPPPPIVAEPVKKSPFFIQKLNEFYAALKGVTSSLPLIGNK